MNLRSISVVLGVLTIAAACGYPQGVAAPEPLGAADVQRAQARDSGVTAESLEEGRTLFVANCNRCHGYPAATSHAPSEWPPIVQRMADKAGLGPSESQRVLEFVLAAGAEAPTSGGQAAP